MARKKYLIPKPLLDEIVRQLDPNLPPYWGQPPKPSTWQSIKSWTRLALSIIVAGNPVLGYARLVLLLLVLVANVARLFS